MRVGSIVGWCVDIFFVAEVGGSDGIIIGLDDGSELISSYGLFIGSSYGKPVGSLLDESVENDGTLIYLSEISRGFIAGVIRSGDRGIGDGVCSGVLKYIGGKFESGDDGEVVS